MELYSPLRPRVFNRVAKALRYKLETCQIIDLRSRYSLVHCELIALIFGSSFVKL
jgi:hypothetical protein